MAAAADEAVPASGGVPGGDPDGHEFPRKRGARDEYSKGSRTGCRCAISELLLWLLPGVFAFSLFAPCIAYSEWYVDELFAVLRNEDARGEGSLRQVFTNDFWGNPLRGGKGSWTHKSYRPLSVLSFAWQFWLLGGDLFRPQPLRAFNVALHTANSLLMMAVLRRGLRFSARWSCLAACLFAAHPVHAENIVYLVGRADALATTGWLVSALIQLRALRTRRRDSPKGVGRPAATVIMLVCCTVIAVASALCKESGLMLLVFVAGVELCTPCALWSSNWPSRCCGVDGLPAAILALALFGATALARFHVTQGTSAAFGYVDTPVQYHNDKVVRTWSYLSQHAYYAKLLVLPGDLSWDYSFDALPLLRAGWRDVRALGVLAAYLGIVALVATGFVASTRLGNRRSRRRLLLGLQQVIIPFVPASNLFFTVGVTVGERLLYPSTAGAAIVAAALGQASEEELEKQRPPKRPPRWPALLASALLAVYTWRCGRRVWQWRSAEALYAADAAAWPTSVKTRHQIGTVYHAQGRYAEALDHYNASLQILDDNALTDHCIAQVYLETGRFNDALARFEKILRGHGVGFSQFNLWMLYVDYGFTLVSLQRHQDAVPALQHGLSMNAAVPHGQNALGYAYANLHLLQEAQDAFAKGLEYDPDNGIIWNNMAVVWMVAGAFQQAAQGLERALTLEPEHPAFVHNAILLKTAVANDGDTGGRRPQLQLFFSRLG